MSREHGTSVEPPARAVGAFHHGAVSRFNAWSFTALARYLNLVARHHKDRAFDGLAGPVILEIGAGTGANLARIPPEVGYHVLEPSLAMHPRLHERCGAAGLDTTIHAAGAEAIPLPGDARPESIAAMCRRGSAILSGSVMVSRRASWRS